jgi:hypothetical protein
MKVLLFVLTLFVFQNSSNEVYICKGSTSKVYHKSEKCNGLKRCSSGVSKLSQDEAEKMGRRACKLEN